VVRNMKLSLCIEIFEETRYENLITFFNHFHGVLRVCDRRPIDLYETPCRINSAGYAIRVEIEKFDNQLIKREYIYRTSDCQEGTVGAIKTVNMMIRSSEADEDRGPGDEYRILASQQADVIKTMANPSVYNRSYKGNLGPVAYTVCEGDRVQRARRGGHSYNVRCQEEANQTFTLRATQFDNGVKFDRLSYMDDVFLQWRSEPTGSSAHQLGTDDGSGDSTAREVF
jgi:hypothetical protein